MTDNEINLELIVNGKCVIERSKSMSYDSKELAFLICLLLAEKDVKLNITIELEKNGK